MFFKTTKTFFTYKAKKMCTIVVRYFARNSRADLNESESRVWIDKEEALCREGGRRGGQIVEAGGRLWDRTRTIRQKGYLPHVFLTGQQVIRMNNTYKSVSCYTVLEVDCREVTHHPRLKRLCGKGRTCRGRGGRKGLQWLQTSDPEVIRDFFLL